ncbi:MAG: DUF2845 domain-containing protein [Gammaproteobacteria bacterium]|nr:DUF2845 domain-containing protein [Gammaproteobacteria bacterium]
MTSNCEKQILRVARLAGALALLVLVVQPAQAAMRCGSQLVSDGDHKLQVLHKCGPPALVEYRGYQYRAYLPHNLPGVHTQLIGANVEEWTYNFGPRRFMRLVRFADSEVVRIISLDYGY